MSDILMLVLASAINCINPNLKLNDNDLNLLYSLAKKHDLTHLVGYALQKNKLLPKNDMGKAFENAVFMAVYRYEQQKYELTRICDALEKAKIPFIPLKGSVIRQYYPEPWMRTSCDIDVYIDKSNLEKANKIFKTQLDYESGFYSQYDVSYKSKSGVHIELHFDLTDDERFPRINDILKSIWNNAVLKEGKAYQHLMTNEMFYFYHIAHMVKHFKNGGCGVRPFLDIWVIKNKLTFNEAEKNSLLERGGISDFADLSEKTAEMWFNNKNETEETRLLADFILFGGVYGNSLNKAALMEAENKKTELFNIKKLFKPYSELKYWYPSLEKHKILLPFYQVRRWYDVAFGGTMERKINQKNLTDNMEEKFAEKTKRLYDILNIGD